MQDSIYQYISLTADENPGLPYRFQDPLLAGRRDVGGVFWGEALPDSLKEKLALELMEVVNAKLKVGDPDDALKDFLETAPIYQYISQLTKRIKLLIAEKLLNDDELYAFGMRLATQSVYDEEVKLGILILGFFDNDIARQVITVLGLHSVLTMFAVKASENFVDNNEFLFYLLQNTVGYGKMCVLHFFEPVLPKHKKWLFEYGSQNEAAPNLSAIMCLEKVDMAAYYDDLTLTINNFSNLSFLLTYAVEESHLSDFTLNPMIFEKYLDAAPKLARHFIDFAALTVLKKSMIAAGYGDDTPYYDEENEDECELYKTCCEILGHKKWKKILLSEMEQPLQSTSIVILALKESGLVPGFPAFAHLLERDWFDMEILDFLLLVHPDYYLTAVIEYLNTVVPDEVLAENPQDITENDLSSIYKPDFWHVFLLKAFRKQRRNDEALFIRCLTSRFPDLRIEAVNALRIFKGDWGTDVRPALEHACEIEPVGNILKKMQRLLGSTSDPHKEQRYVDTAEIAVKTSTYDTCVINTEIAGTVYRDLLPVEGQIESGDILYLMREPENRYDSNAILVTSDDGYVLGYVPRVDNDVPAAMLVPVKSCMLSLKAETWNTTTRI